MRHIQNPAAYNVIIACAGPAELIAALPWQAAAAPEPSV